MKSNAATVQEYLATLPEDRRASIQQVREVILKNLDPEYEECMVWGVIGYAVPNRAGGLWPEGHHTDPSKPLLMIGLSSQKNDMVVYLMNVHRDTALRAWFEQAWAKSGGTGKKLNLSAEGGCCLRFRKIEDVALDVIGESVRRTPARAYIQNHVKMLASLKSGRKGTEGKKVKGGTEGKGVKKVGKKKATKKVGGKKVGGKQVGNKKAKG